MARILPRTPASMVNFLAERIARPTPTAVASANSLAVSLSALGEHQQARQLNEDTLTRRKTPPRRRPPRHPRQRQQPRHRPQGAGTQRGRAGMTVAFSHLVMSATPNTPPNGLARTLTRRSNRTIKIRSARSSGGTARCLTNCLTMTANSGGRDAERPPTPQKEAWRQFAFLIAIASSAHLAILSAMYPYTC